MPAAILAEFLDGIRRNSGECQQLFWRNSIVESGGMPAVTPVEFLDGIQRNSGEMPAIIPAEFRGGIPPELTRNSARVNPEFQRNTGGMPATIPEESSGIHPDFTRNSTGIPEHSGVEYRRDSTGIPVLFLQGFAPTLKMQLTSLLPTSSVG